MADLTAIEAQIGVPPGDPKLRMTPKTVELVKQWMVAQGFDSSRISGCRENTLYRAYANPNCLRQMRSRSDYFPAAARARTQEQQPMWEIKPKPTAAPAPEPAPVDVTGLAQVIAAALQPVLAPAGITEYRVIEIIHQEVPGIVRAVLSDIFANRKE